MYNTNKENAEMREARLKILIYKYLTQTLTEPDKQELEEMTRQHPALPALLERLRDEDALQKDLEKFAAIDGTQQRERTWAKIREHKIRQQRTKTIRRVIGWVAGTGAVAAALIILFRWPFPTTQPLHPTQKLIATAAPLSKDAAPGMNKAILTLADGRQIGLDTLHTGNMIDQATSTIHKQDSGKLIYNYNNKLRNTELNPLQYADVPHNKLTTPRAGQFTIQLPDGTTVFLNSASSLKYPTAFTGAFREVELTGEGYFEVQKDPSRPFRVKVGGLLVNVLGTHFDIKDYNNGKKIKTTLIRGSVQVSDGKRQEVLHPGEALNIKEDNSWKVQKGVDTAGVIAWTSGYFHFAATELSAVMEELSRWYDVEVEIQGGATELINAEIPRNYSLSTVLKSLGIPHTFEGKKLTILKE